MTYLHQHQYPDEVRLEQQRAPAPFEPQVQFADEDSLAQRPEAHPSDRVSSRMHIYTDETRTLSQEDTKWCRTMGKSYRCTNTKRL